MLTVVQLNEGSALHGQVRVGDSLLRLDDVDCRRMTAAEVSQLVGSRSGASERTFVLLRQQ